MRKQWFCSTSLSLFFFLSFFADLTMGTAAAPQVAPPCWGAPMVNVVCVFSMEWSRMAAAKQEIEAVIVAFIWLSRCRVLWQTLGGLRGVAVRRGNENHSRGLSGWFLSSTHLTGPQIEHRLQERKGEIRKDTFGFSSLVLFKHFWNINWRVMKWQK